MRFLPRFAIALFLCALATPSLWAQRLQCNPCSHGFGVVQVGQSRSYSVQLTNSGGKSLSITSKSVHGKGFSVGTFPLPKTLRPGASVQLPLTFTPVAAGHATGSITLVSTAQDSKLTIDVKGTGISTAALGISPAALDFGSVAVGSNASLQATLTALNDSVTISSDDSSSEFAIVGLSLPVTLKAGQSLPVTIQFTPTGSGTASGQAEFISDAPGPPTAEPLTGIGMAGASHSVYLSWKPGDGSAVGYNVYRGSVKRGPYSKINTALDASTNYTDNTVVSGKTYFYVATEVNAEGEESAYSYVAKAMIPK